MSVVRAAAIDCGTNSIRLLIADVDLAAGTAHDVTRTLEIVRLGQGVDRTGSFAPEALERTFAACRRFAEVLRTAGGPPLRFVATSAARDVADRSAFAAGVRAALGVDPEVIDGAEEARLSFLGASRGLPADLPAPYLVVDIGGGSTELVHGSTAPGAFVSLDVGSVRLTERHRLSDPPTPDQVAAMRADVAAALARAGAVVPLDRPATLVGLAGTVTTLAAIALGRTDYDSARIHHSRIPAARVRTLSDALLAMPRAQRLAMPGMLPGREDVIATGALLLRGIVDRTGAAEVLVSEHDLLDGVVGSVAAAIPAQRLPDPVRDDDPVA